MVEIHEGEENERERLPSHTGRKPVTESRTLDMGGRPVTKVSRSDGESPLDSARAGDSGGGRQRETRAGTGEGRSLRRSPGVLFNRPTRNFERAVLVR